MAVEFVSVVTVEVVLLQYSTVIDLLSIIVRQSSLKTI